MAGTDKRDIMDDLLKGTSEDAPSEVKSLDKLIHRELGKEQAPAAKSTEKATTKKKRPKASKKKTTYYLSENIYDNLGDARDKINELIHMHLKSRVSKSKIVDQALKMILKDFEEKGEKSPLIQEILKDIFKGK